MLYGNGLLVIGALGCMLAPSINWLLTARFIQGLGAATSAVVVSAIVADCYSTAKAAKLYGIMNAVFTGLMAVAPIMGGLINGLLGWRGNYGLVAGICTLSFILLAWLLPETRKAEKTKDTKLSVNLKQITSNYIRLISHPVFVSAAIIPSLLYGGYLTFIGLAPFIYKQLFKVTTHHYILYQSVAIATFATSSLCCHLITRLLGIKFTLYLAINLIIVASLWLFFAVNAMSLTLAMCLFCAGFALIYPHLFAYSMAIFPELRGTASSAIISLRYLVCAIVTSTAGYFYNGTVSTLAMVLLATTLVITGLFIWVIPTLIIDRS
jgi:DHA1 family bicyclomycin/chloramphenicol resistance-like MFS transporter